MAQSALQRTPIPQGILLRIVRAEDERRWDAAEFGELFMNADPRVRRRAVLAAGRIGDGRAIPLLVSRLSLDADESVRAMAAFALGATDSAVVAAPALIQSLRTNRSIEVRARAIEALGKIAAALSPADEAQAAALGEAILDALRLENRQFTRPARAGLLEGLTAALRARPAGAGQVVAPFLSSPDARVRADAANALARLRAPGPSDRLRALLAGDTDPVVRANAARALGASEDHAALETLIARSINDPDERVRVGAIRALGSLHEARSAEPLLHRAEILFVAYRTAKARGVAHPSEINELLEIVTTLGRVLANTGDEHAVTLLRALREAERLGAPEVEMALARLAPAQYLREPPFTKLPEAVARYKANSQWQTPSALAQGLGAIADITTATGGNIAVSAQADAQIALRTLLDDQNTPPLAMPEVLRALAAFKPDDLGPVLRPKLSAADTIVRATAAELLGDLPPDTANERALVEALPLASRDEMNDALLAILDALAKQRTATSLAAIKTVLDSPDYLVRRRAVALLKANGAGDFSSHIATVATRNGTNDYRRALARAGKLVRAFVATDKGSFTIELLPDDAPLTVDNFVELARRGFFNNLTFHRVVPNFVIQGGDPRGDGNGGPGYQIRCEINETPYLTGTVGMALSGKDTGGSQWFVTHSPQPHLDGGYTVFGQVIDGMDVVDRIARGDHIRSIFVLEKTRARPLRGARRGALRR